MKKTTVLALCATTVFTAPLLAQDASETARRYQSWGTSDSPTAHLLNPDIAAGTITAFKTFKEAGYGSGGVGLRNRDAGGLSVSGVNAPIKAAYLYWGVITTGAAAKPDQSLKIQRLAPTPASTEVTVKGTSLGTGASPCWPGDTITIFRGSVPLSVANGNGSYQVTLLAGAAGTTDGSDPFLTYVVPLFEGASLVMVGSGAATVSVYDMGLAAHTFAANPGLTYSLKLPTAAAGNQTLIDVIGADGQHGNSRTATSLSNKMTTVNSVAMSGPGSVYLDNDWSGSAALPLPQLWDDTGHDITAATPNGTKTLNVNISSSASPYDCLTTVANVVQVE